MPKNTALFSIVLLICAASACVPIPVRSRTVAAPGKSTIDVSFVQAGVSTREEIENRLQSIRAADLPGMFWGRYFHSSVYVAGRDWQMENLVVQYDEHNVAKSVRTVSTSEVGRILIEWLASQPVRGNADENTALIRKGWTSGHRREAEVTLDSANITIVDNSRGPTFKVPLTNVTRAAVADYGYGDGWTVPPAILMLIRAADGKQHRDVEVRLLATELPVWLDFIRRHCPNAKYE